MRGSLWAPTAPSRGHVRRESLGDAARVRRRERQTLLGSCRGGEGLPGRMRGSLPVPPPQSAGEGAKRGTPARLWVGGPPERHMRGNLRVLPH